MNNTIFSIRNQTDWNNSVLARQQGPNLPANVDVVQTSGGHNSPVFYVSDASSTKRLWKSDGIRNWQPIVGPGLAATQARRFFVDPYNPELIYVTDQDNIKLSDDGGRTWHRDLILEDAVTAHQQFSSNDAGVIQDMVFDRENRTTRFAVGVAGVFYTLDGRNWSRLLNTAALPSKPVSAFFDPVSDVCNRMLYVATDGHGILRIGPIPAAPSRTNPCGIADSKWSGESLNRGGLG
jgi:hypothetical protein